MKLIFSHPLSLTIPHPPCQTCNDTETDYSTKIKPLLEYFGINHTFIVEEPHSVLTLHPQWIRITEHEATLLFNQLLNQFNLPTTCYAVGGNEQEFCIEL